MDDFSMSSCELLDNRKGSDFVLLQRFRTLPDTVKDVEDVDPVPGGFRCFALNLSMVVTRDFTTMISMSMMSDQR